MLRLFFSVPGRLRPNYRGLVFCMAGCIIATVSGVARAQVRTAGTPQTTDTPPAEASQPIAQASATSEIAEPVATSPSPETSNRANGFRVTITNSVDASASTESARSEQSPSAKHLILFDDGKVYDFSLLPPLEVTIIDEKQKRIELVSLEKQTRCAISTDHLLSELARVIADTKSSSLRENIGLDATVVVNQESGRHSIEYGRFRYETKITPAPSRQVAVQFAQFADWAMRLNMIRNLGVPPFGRMKLNESLASTSSLPQQVWLTVKSNAGNQVFQSEYQWGTELSQADRMRIENINGMIQSYRQVSPVDF